MHLRRATIYCLLLSLLLTLSSACSLSRTPASASTSTTPGAEPSAPVTLVLWHGWSGAQRQMLNRIVDRFNQGRTSGRVLPQSVSLATLSADLRAASQAGTGPHVALIPNSWIGGLARDEMLLPLDEEIPAESRRDLLPVTLSGARAAERDGVERLYGLPISFDTLALFYNRANLSEAPEDTGVLINLAHGLSAPDADPPRWGLALNLSLDNTIGYLYAFGGRVFDESGQLQLGGDGREGAERWLTWLAELKNDPQLLAQLDAGIQVDREIKNQNVFITFGWAHQVADYRRLWGEQLGIGLLPRLGETAAAPQPYVQSQVLAINSRAGEAERRAAVEFLRFMVGEEAQRELLLADLQPTSGALALDGKDAQQAAARVFREQARQGQPMPNLPEREMIRQTLTAMQRQVLSGQVEPRDAVTEADRKLRELLQLPAQ